MSFSCGNLGFAEAKLLSMQLIYMKLLDRDKWKDKIDKERIKFKFKMMKEFYIEDEDDVFPWFTSVEQ